jgi:hypothetical protein
LAAAADFTLAMDFWFLCDEEEFFKLDFGTTFVQTNPSDEQAKARKKRVHISKEADLEMTLWVFGHQSSLRPTSADVIYFMEKYGLTRYEVKTALRNRRRRIARPPCLEFLPRLDD